MNRMTCIIRVNLAENMAEHIEILHMHQRSNKKLIASWLFPGRKYLPLLGLSCHDVYTWHMLKFSHSMNVFPISDRCWDCLPKPDHLFCSKKHVLRFTGVPISFDFYVSSSVPFPHLLKEDMFSDMKSVV